MAGPTAATAAAVSFYADDEALTCCDGYTQLVLIPGKISLQE